MDKAEFNSVFSRLREAVRFLIKSDAIVFAGIFTLVGVFKLEWQQAIQLGGSLTWVLNFTVSLLIASLAYEGFITATSPSTDSDKNATFAKIARYGYLTLVLLHCAAAVYALGYAVGVLEGFSKIPK